MKIDNVEWLINNKDSILKHITIEENKEAFCTKWQNNEDIKKAFEITFVNFGK